MATHSVARTVTRYFFFTLCAWTFSSLCMMQQMPGGQAPMNAKDDPFSPENIAQVAEEISKLTPEQQDQLYKESLDFLSKELNLSPEEVEKMITEEFTQGAAPAPDMPQPKGPSAEALNSEPISTPKVEEKIVPIKDLNDVANLLKNLADVTDTIMRKASGLPDLPSRVDRWVEQKKLTSWQSHLTWASFKKQLELLVQKLGKLQNKDPRTNTYLYLPELLSNVSLKNNLERIYRTLKRFNAEFTTSTFDIDMALDDPLSGAGSLSAEAKDALLGILNTYGDAFYAQNLFKDLDALVQKFDPAAQKLRAAEEASAKKALEASKQTRSTTGIKVGGSKDTFSGGRDSYYGEPSNNGYYPGSYNSGSSYGGYPSDSAKSSDKKDADANESKKAAPGGEAKDKKDSEKLKSMLDWGRDIASLISELGSTISNDTNFSAENLDLLKKGAEINDAFRQNIQKFASQYEKIEQNSNTLIALSKNSTEQEKGDIFAPIRAAYARYPKLLEIAKNLASIKSEKIEKPKAPQEPEILAPAAEKDLYVINALQTEIAALPEGNDSLEAELIDRLATMTMRPLARVTKKDALDLLKNQSASIQYSELYPELAKKYEARSKKYETETSIKGLKDTLGKLDSLVKGLPQESVKAKTSQPSRAPQAKTK